MTRVSLVSLLLLISNTALLLAQQPPSYVRDVKPFLRTYCVECHNSIQLKGGLDLQSFKALAAGSKKGPVIEAGKPDDSRLVLVAEGKEKPFMPPEKSTVPKADEVKVLRAWVAAGAKDDTGTTVVTLPEIKPKAQQPAPVSSVSYQPDGKLLAASGYQHVFLIDPSKGEVIGRIAGQTERVTAIVFSPEGQRLAVASGTAGKSGEIRLYSVKPDVPQKPVLDKTIAAHKDLILNLAFSPDGKTLASCSYDRLIKIWNVSDGQEVRALKDHSDSVYGVAFNSDGTLLASASADRAVKVWDVSSGTRLYTLSEATDWVYAVVWSRQGNQLAAAGVDRSIRVWEATRTGGKIVHSVFAHEGAVLRLAYSQDDGTLYSLGEDGFAKAWDAQKMVERHVYEKQPAPLALAVSPDHKQLAMGRFDGTLLLLDESTGKEQTQPLPTKALPPDRFTPIEEVEPNDSQGTANKITLPVSIGGAMDKAGDVDFYRFEARAGDEIGVQAVTAAIGSKLEPVLTLLDAAGNQLAESNNGLLGYTCTKAGAYILGIRDREYRGGPDMPYRLHVGPIPIVTSFFPLGLQRGTEVEVAVHGVNLGDVKSLRVKASGDAVAGSRLPLVIDTKNGAPLGEPALIIGEFAESVDPGKPLQPPITCNGILQKEKQADIWRFQAKKGERLIVEVNARRLGAPLDSFIEVLDAQGQPVPRAVLRSQARTYITFRDHDAVGAGIRIETWSELAVNDYLYGGSELLKIEALPKNPDDDCRFFSFAGQRLGFLDTTPTYHSNGTAMYKVSVHPPGTKFPPNGFPVFTLFYQNDDGGPGHGKDSRLFFDPPADGEFQVRIRDTRGQGGSDYAYRLTIRPPRPGYNISFSPTAPALSKGGAVAITATAERLDGYDGPIDLRLQDLPPGFSAPATAILPGETSTSVALFAEPGAAVPEKKPFKLVARAKIDGKEEVREAAGTTPTLLDPGDIVTTTQQSEVTIQPGKETRLTVRIERKNGFTGRVPIEVKGLPHGVRVLDIGLNGILITENATERTFVIYAEPWVQATEHPFVVLARREGKNTEHAARSVLLKVER